MSDTHTSTLDNLSHETRAFAPSAEFVANAIGKPEQYEAANADRLGYWAETARKVLTARSTPPTTRWTATSKTGSATASPSTSRASRATPARTPTHSSPMR